MVIAPYHCTARPRVSATQVDVGAFRAGFGDQAISRGACVNVSQLDDGAQYKFNVTPWSEKRGDGKPASVTSYIGKASFLR